MFAFLITDAMAVTACKLGCDKAAQVGKHKTKMEVWAARTLKATRNTDSTGRWRPKIY